ncbi:hypothetical protein SPRG_20532 [Saprolegnia parasitica CBS 223.65]|uniref:Uncharacterized protein n=1 Tax=Saprolegnia parasitica (strain CBS 223.65) TaxID=695850 RepID=A0A067CJN4_SAPPC|nr:hypothetical protein SPRG_20532 [Saprolegnia parasitica CBS 223.65]KDO26736.1 hypothetical protein SPRG_20532 [Saprolegnia parasitica CBS 223.65]|eukprot:XP_012202616.1 hypothetical protein SPRG_20532 [Saprolegnia parasitica CBS 223.65]
MEIGWQRVLNCILLRRGASGRAVRAVGAAPATQAVAAGVAASGMEARRRIFAAQSAGARSHSQHVSLLLRPPRVPLLPTRCLVATTIKLDAPAR